jgi:hypothetical protein
MERIQRDQRRFSGNETADIFDLASAIEGTTSHLDRDLSLEDLYRIADELGISSAAIDAAIRDLGRRDRAEAREAKRNVKRRMRFIRHAMVYTIAIVMLAIVDALGGGGWWFFYVAGLWGILLAMHGLRFVTRRNGPLERRLAGT